jgi:aspartate 1-decarboxylase
MTICLLKSKIHRAAVTAASLDYEGSLTIAADLAEKVGLRHYERILVGNMANGERFETYVILGASGSGAIELNGATAHLGKPGDRLTIMSFGHYTAQEARHHQPAVIVLDATNAIVRDTKRETTGH